MDNKKIVKKYFNKYFKEQYFHENDYEFRSLVRILNKKDKKINDIIKAVDKIDRSKFHDSVGGRMEYLDAKVKLFELLKQ